MKDLRQLSEQRYGRRFAFLNRASLARDRMRLSYQIVAATMLQLFIGVFRGGLFGSMPPEGAKQSVVPKGPNTSIFLLKAESTISTFRRGSHQ